MSARDLVAVAEVAEARGISVALVEQPYRVAGRRSAAPAPQLDAAWSAVAAQLSGQGGPFHGLPLIAGGRSSGARVACRTAATTGAIAVLCLAFPLQPPRRRTPTPREVGPPGRPPRRSGAPGATPSRLPELEGVEVPVLVVQGERDPFGMPPPGPRRAVVPVPGTHALGTALGALREAVAAWLEAVVP